MTVAAPLRGAQVLRRVYYFFCLEVRREEGDLPQDKNIDVQPNQQVEGTAGWEGEAAGMLSAEQCTPSGKTRTHILYTHAHTHTPH